ncbi:hypothetical protein Q7P37_003870 [Cladosporium fusiforme]
MPSDSAPSPPPSPPPVPRPPRGWHRSAHGSGDELGMYYDPSRPPAEYEERARYELPPEPLARFEDSYYDRRHSSEALRYDDRRRSPIAPLGRRPRSPPSYPEPFSRRSDPYYDRRDTEALHYEDRRYSPTSFPPRRPRSPPGFSYSRDIYYGDHRRDTPPSLLDHVRTDVTGPKGTIENTMNASNTPFQGTALRTSALVTSIEERHHFRPQRHARDPKTHHQHRKTLQQVPRNPPPTLKPSPQTTETALRLAETFSITSSAKNLVLEDKRRARRAYERERERERDCEAQITLSAAAKEGVYVHDSCDYSYLISVSIQSEIPNFLQFHLQTPNIELRFPD